MPTGETAAPQIVVMGVSGSGKSTVGALLASELGVPFLDGDSLHSAENVAKMSVGTPLTDNDRWPWLAEVGRALAVARETGRGVVIACSALKRSYRDAICSAAPDALFVHLDGRRDVLVERMSRRGDHFMPTMLLDSQLSTLERLSDGERGARIDIGSPIEAVVRNARRALDALPVASGSR